MIKSFQENKDIYSFIAAIAFNKTYDECREFTPDGVYNPEGKARRTEAKSVVLGRPRGLECPPSRSIITQTARERNFVNHITHGCAALLCCANGRS